MHSIFSLYFTSLIQRFLLLCLLCSFIPLILLSYQYEWQTSLIIYKDSLLLTIPWLLFFQQIVFCAFITPKNFISRFFLIMISTILSTIILMFALPYTQTSLNIDLNKITPNIIQPKKSTILNQQGTFVIDPLHTETPLYADSNTKALWISSNFISFNKIKTNTQSFELTKPYSFTSYGFQAQEGVAIIPFFQGKMTSPILPLGQQILQYWLNSVISLNQTIKELYKIINIPLIGKTSIYHQKIRTSKSSKPTNNYDSNIFQEYQQVINNSKKQNSQIPIPLNVNIIDYLNIFVNILCVFSLLSLIGISISIRQHFAGIFALVMLLAFFISYIPTQFFQISLQLSRLIPSFSILFINLILITIFYSISIILYGIKKSIGDTY